SYRAPGPQKPARAPRVTITRTSSRAIATWASARGARTWRVVATASDGRRWSVLLSQRSLALPSVFRSTTVRVSVRGVSAAGVVGPAKAAVSRGR
ncbi:hypothetical protein, partial [Nocardioides sp.]|uniref:hypothetical protein n=1 Tax=Nocardioides sp. TaxID=35761 RepID=UPI0025ECA18C